MQIENDLKEKELNELLETYRRIKRSMDEFEEALRFGVWVLAAVLLIWGWFKVTDLIFPLFPGNDFIKVVVSLLGILILVLWAKNETRVTI